MSDGRVEFEITADGSKAYASIDQITNALKKAGNDWEKTSKESTESIGKDFSSLISKLSVAAIGAGIVNGLKSIASEAIEAASELAEVQNVVDVTFGESGAMKIEAWAKKAGDQFGLTETQAKRFTSTLGAMMKSAGLSGNQITDISTDLAGLAADMASFYNLNFDEAFQKIRSGISGETEPLKQLGVNMSVANLNAFALQKGLSKTFDKMTQGEQVMLRYQYLMQATADAQGDFSRTADGFANASRRVETALNTIKTNIGNILLPFIESATEKLATFLEKLTGNGNRTVLDDFRDIDLKTEEKFAQIEATAEQARTLTDVLDGIGNEIGKNKEEAGKMLDNVPDGKSGKLADLVGSIEGVESAAVGARESISSMVDPTAETAETDALWLETCKELVNTIPGLSDLINVETGEIKGGTAAVREYIDAWEKGQKGLAMQSAHEQKRNALDSAFSDLPGLELTKTVAEHRVKKAQAQMQQMADQMGITLDWDRVMKYEGQPNMLTEEQKRWNAEVEYYYTLKQNAAEATADYKKQKQAYDEAVEAYEYEGKVIESTYGQAIENLDEWTDEQKEAARAAVTAFEEAVNAVKQYKDQVRETTASQVNSRLSGFSEVQTAADQYKDAANAAKEFRDELIKARKDGKNNYTDYEIEIKVNDKNAQVTLNSMIQGLESQLSYIEEYQKNLQTAREAGISDEILQQLSDGSNESALYLNAIAEAAKSGNQDQINELNNMWLKANEGKEKFVDTLTNQKLEVDKQYDAMVKKAEEAAKGLDVSDTASQSTAKNINAMAQAIKDHVPDVATQVDAVLAELNRLNAWGVNINLGAFGSFSIGNLVGSAASTVGSVIDGSHATGLNYVPFDHYLAELHAGEGILTAEENRVWQRFKNGQRGVDYDTLGGVMRDSIKPGGNVYLDGRVVGSVISEIQGNQYRALQRSGWQQ